MFVWVWGREGEGFNWIRKRFWKALKSLKCICEWLEHSWSGHKILWFLGIFLEVVKLKKINIHWSLDLMFLDLAGATKESMLSKYRMFVHWKWSVRHWLLTFRDVQENTRFKVCETFHTSRLQCNRIRGCFWKALRSSKCVWKWLENS